MWQFFIDAKELFLLRLKPIEEYRYDPATVIAIVVALSLLQTVGMVPLLGSGITTIAFSFCMTVIQWAALSQVMKWVLYANQAPKLPLAHFILLSEALVLPGALFLWFSPEVSSLANFSLSIFTFSIQIVALIRFSGLSLWKVLLGYLCYVPTMMVLMMLVFAIFVLCGWIDFNTFLKTMEELQQQAK